MFIDTHCHIQSAGQTTGERSTRELWAKADVSADIMISEAIADDVTKLVCVGCDIADSRLVTDFVQDHAACWASVAVHPHEASATLQADILSELDQLAERPRVVAIGECGLDYFYEHSTPADQATVLRYQLDLAVRLGLPVIFHVREAFEDFWPIFDSYDGAIRGVLHSFTDTLATLEAAIERDLYIGVNGIATFAKQAEQVAMYKAIPLENLVFETDAPFLTPVPFRGKINQPKQIRTIASFLADLRGESLGLLAEKTTANAKHLFDI